MKYKNISAVVLAGILTSLLLLTGCETTPNGFDRLFMDITTNAPTITTHTLTNWVSVTNTFTRTNELSLTNFVTGERTITNFVTQTQTVNSNPVILSVVITNPPTYNYTPNTNADKLKEGAGLIGNMVAPGVGGPVASGVVGLLLTGYAWIRGNKHRDTSAALAQGIETAREVIRTAVPNGNQYDAAFVDWLKAHQLEEGVLKQVGVLLAKSVDPEKASGAADIIGSAADALIAQGQPTKVAT